ncbi:MAG: glycoside hydrolase family 3 protein [Phycisphaeraceae bacterium]|nr:MAG: glycoside hydrolase family 3 protein [Phycisphaeraceae bacterium]
MPGHDLHQLIGRLLMVGVRGDGPSHPDFRRDLEACKAAAVKNIILFDVHLPRARELEAQGLCPEEARTQATRNITSPEQLRALTDLLREDLGDDLLIAVDQEGGAVARLSPARGFAPSPSPREFAALPEIEQRREAEILAQQVRAVGVDINFAPCIDLAINPDNPIIARLGRAFSADPEVVTGCAREIIDAHIRAGVAPCLKHFPGHGSSTADSHLGAADVTETFDAELELAPYLELLSCHRPSSSTVGAASEHGSSLEGDSTSTGAPTVADDGRWHGFDHDSLLVMTAHILDRAVDPEFPASLSRAHTTDLLRKKLGFEGVVIIDSLDMNAVADRWPPGESAVHALNAGADLILHGFNASSAESEHPALVMSDFIAGAIESGQIEGGVDRLGRSAERVNRLRHRLRSGR